MKGIVDKTKSFILQGSEKSMGKSSGIQLMNRGYISEEDLSKYMNSSEDDLLELINSREAYERSIAVRLLAILETDDNNIIILFCEKLTKENKLYTKIEICNALSIKGKMAAKVMVKYLGRIGHNQHAELPKEDFKKKSYPLPRDIISRTLAHMGKEVLPELVEVLKTNNILAIREVTDAIGFICFYEYTDYPLNDLIFCFNEKRNDDIIRWKMVRALGSFNRQSVIDILMNVKQNDAQERIKKEAERSLNIISHRT